VAHAPNSIFGRRRGQCRVWSRSGWAFQAMKQERWRTDKDDVMPTRPVLRTAAPLGHPYLVGRRTERNRERSDEGLNVAGGPGELSPHR
jgi:hypothetical protein